MLELGVCYYPEQWDESLWSEDARRMVELGLTWVRVGEFAWAEVEPEPGVLRFERLDQAVEILGRAGLKVIMGTPTAAPPKWLVDKHPDILARGRDGQLRKFGSRRHYCFSSLTYRREANRIVTLFAERYGSNPHVAAWQTDNEYGDHDTVRSYSEAAQAAFRLWLEARYGTIDALNDAWGTRFWSMRYRSFAEIDLPNLLVDLPTPTHEVDFYRFCSDQVRSFNRAQVEIIRRNAPERPVTHNFMSHNTDFDHHTLGEDIDIASWDSYPMGGLLNGRLPAEDKLRYLRVGDPDQPAFNHDLYRAVGRGKVWVMEMQPGPVNWARHNQSPADGMIRLWTYVAYGHGVDMVSYFRWRQAPFGQEQFHAGLLLPDGTPDQGHAEVQQVIAEIAQLPDPGPRQKASVAMVLDYPSRWAIEALPQGEDYHPGQIALEWYAAMARRGVDIDLIGPGSDLSGYRLILVPDLAIATTAFVERLAACEARLVFGPRAGSKTERMQIPATLPPGPLAGLIDMRVTRVESLPPGQIEPVLYGNRSWASHVWRETIETTADTLAHFDGPYRQGAPAVVGNAKARYFAMLPDPDLLSALLGDALGWAGIEAMDDLGDLRITRRGILSFAFNFGSRATQAPVPDGARVLLGQQPVPPADVLIWVEGSGKVSAR